MALSEGSAVGSSDIDSDAAGFGAAPSSLDELVRAKIARRTTPATTRKRIPLELFFAGAAAGAAAFAGAGVLVTVVEPRVGTGGITILEASTLLEDFFADARFAGAFLGGRFAAAFLAGRFADFVDFFAAFLAGRFAAAFFTGRFAAFFFAATTTPSSHSDHEHHASHDAGISKAYPRPYSTERYEAPIKGAIFGAIARSALPR